MRDKQKLGAIIIVIILIIGIAIIAMYGYNFSVEYDKSKKIQIYLGQEFSTLDIKNIAELSFPNKSVEIQKVDLFNDTVIINVKQATDEELNTLVTNINSVYELDYEVDDLLIVDVPHTQFIDIIKPYLLPIGIGLIISIAYIAIRYRKLGLIKVIFQPLFVIAVSEALLFSLFAITRFPIGRFTMPIALTVFVIALTAVIGKYENKIK